MSINEKAIANIENDGFVGKEQNGTVYLCIGDKEFELAEFEIKYQANVYDEENA